MTVDRGGPDRTSSLAEKFRGALVGAAVGDALGSFFEGRPSLELEELEKLEEDPGLLEYTDDTHMTIGMAESLAARGGFDGPHMAHTFVRNYVDEPWRGYGPGPPQVFLQLAEGAEWDQAGRTLFDGTGSYGNGAAMRVAPAALVAFQDLEGVRLLAENTAVITHAHELGIRGAVLQAWSVALALRSTEGQPIDADTFLDTLRSRIESDPYEAKLEQAGRLLSAHEDDDRETVVDELGNQIEALDSVPTAIYSFLRHHKSFKEVVFYAISLGGDTDTIASMAGALAGAYLGLPQIPQAWRTQVESAGRLEELADSLLDLSTGNA